MSLWQFLKRLFFGSQDPSGTTRRSSPSSGKVRLRPLRRDVDKRPAEPSAGQLVSEKPYRFARRDSVTGSGWFDLQSGGNESELRRRGIPSLNTLNQLAEWLDLSLGQLAWLTHRFQPGGKAPSVPESHYVYHWVDKRSGGQRLIESPKPLLKSVQTKILEQILNQVPVHATCHGFTRGRSILSNAEPHCGQRVVVKFDLENFYPSVTFNRIVAIFRALGYNREIAIWLARLCTTALPSSVPFPREGPKGVLPYLRSHLPQGAPTSPALANLSAYSLDVRLSGLANSFGANYTRYADDLTFSGPQSLFRGLKTLIPLVQQVIRDERFIVHKGKRKVLRNNQQQKVTGVVVNERPNVSRREFDRLKAILFNCIRYGADSQNRDGVGNFREHLRGRIAFVRQLNSNRGNKLLALWERIHW
jgi:retron-type reverse transcriptase